MIHPIIEKLRRPAYRKLSQARRVRLLLSALQLNVALDDDVRLASFLLAGLGAFFAAQDRVSARLARDTGEAFGAVADECARDFDQLSDYLGTFISELGSIACEAVAVDMPKDVRERVYHSSSSAAREFILGDADLRPLLLKDRIEEVDRGIGEYDPPGSRTAVMKILADFQSTTYPTISTPVDICTGEIFKPSGVYRRLLDRIQSEERKAAADKGYVETLKIGVRQAQLAAGADWTD